MSLRKSFQRGEHMIWLTGSALGACVLMIAGLITVILVNGLGFFWPAPLVRITLKDGSVFLGEQVNREPIPNPGQPDHLKHHRIQLKVGNRDLLGFDFKWIDESDITAREQPTGVFTVERREYGPLLGTPVLLKQGDRELAQGPEAIRAALPTLLHQAERDRAAIEHIEKDEIGDINYRIEQARLDARKIDFRAGRGPGSDFTAERAQVERAVADAQREYEIKQAELARLMEKAAATYVTFRTADGDREGAAHARRLPRVPGQRAGLVPARGHLRGPPVDVRGRRPARVQHRGRHLPGHLRHRDDGHHHEHDRGAAGRAGGALPARVRQAGAAGPHRPHRRQQPGGRALDRVRRLRPGLLRLLRGRRHRPRCSSRSHCPRPPTAPAGSCGRRSRWPC